MEYIFRPDEVVVQSWSSKSVGGFSLKEPAGVKVTHIPSGITITCDTQTAQHSNRHFAFIKLEERLKEMQ